MAMIKTYCLILHMSQVMGTKSGFMPTANPEDMAIDLTAILFGYGDLRSGEIAGFGDELL
jgi:hypothetical protein